MVAELLSFGIADDRRTTDEPIAEPLIGNVGLHPVVWRRAYYGIDWAWNAAIGCANRGIAAADLRATRRTPNVL